MKLLLLNFANNHKALNLLHLVSNYATNNSYARGENYAFEFFCIYLSEFKNDVEKKNKVFEILKRNEKLQILCSGELLSNLKSSIS